LIPEHVESTEREAQVARDAAAAFGRAFTEGEIDAFLELLAPEVDYESPSVMQHTVVKLQGRDEVRGYLEQTANEYERLQVEPDEVRDLGGGRFLMVGRWLAQPRQTPTPFGTPVGAVLDIGDGKVVRVRAFFDEQLAVDAARRD
jgi:ketosteroid isomerase-like protein